jgi:hypothetical protein
MQRELKDHQQNLHKLFTTTAQYKSSIFLATQYGTTYRPYLVFLEMRIE